MHPRVRVSRSRPRCLQVVYRGHKDSICSLTAVQLSSFTHVFSGDQSGTLIHWDLATRRPFTTLESFHERNILSLHGVCYSPSSLLLYSHGRDGIVKCYDVERSCVRGSAQCGGFSFCGMCVSDSMGLMFLPSGSRESLPGEAEGLVLTIHAMGLVGSDEVPSLVGSVCVEDRKNYGMVMSASVCEDWRGVACGFEDGSVMTFDVRKSDRPVDVQPGGGGVDESESPPPERTHSRREPGGLSVAFATRVEEAEGEEDRPDPDGVSETFGRFSAQERSHFPNRYHRQKPVFSVVPLATRKPGYLASAGASTSVIVSRFRRFVAKWDWVNRDAPTDEGIQSVQYRGIDEERRAGINMLRSHGRILCTAGWDCTVRLFDIRSVGTKKQLKPLTILRHHTDTVNCVHIAPAGAEETTWNVWSGSKDRKLVSWKVSFERKPRARCTAEEDFGEES